MRNQCLSMVGVICIADLLNEESYCSVKRSLQCLWSVVCVENITGDLFCELVDCSHRSARNHLQEREYDRVLMQFVSFLEQTHHTS